MVHVFISASLCRAQPLTGRLPETSVEFGLRLVSFGPKQQFTSAGPKTSPHRSTSFAELWFSMNYMAVYLLLQPHLTFPFSCSDQYNYIKRC